MTLIEVSGLLIVIVIGVSVVISGDANYEQVTEFNGNGNIALAILGGAALSFFAMTGFENAANVAEETHDPSRCSRRRSRRHGRGGPALRARRDRDHAGRRLRHHRRLRGCAARGRQAGSVGIPTWLFAAIALVAVTNTCLVTMVTQSRILYGMANEDVVPGVFAKVHPKRKTPWVGILFTFVMVVGLLVRRGAEVPTLASASVVFLLVHLRPGDHRLPQAAQGRARSAPSRPAPLLVVGIGQRRPALLRHPRRPELAVVMRRASSP